MAKKIDMVVDIGNTYTKLAFFRDKELEALWTDKEIKEADFRCLIEAHKPTACIISSVRGDQASIPARRFASRPDMVSKADLPNDLKFLADYGFPILYAGAHLPIPLIIRYKTPETLGGDRLAATIAAMDRLPGQHIMVVNLGTCLTTDFINNNNEYLGGTISPGLHMRLKAMHKFTGQLPLVTKIPREIDIVGTTTEESMLSGVVNGIIGEIEGLIKMRQKEISFFNVIISGGDAKFFAKKIKSRIFAIENIVLHGLNLMLKHNAKHL